MKLIGGDRHLDERRHLKSHWSGSIFIKTINMLLLLPVFLGALALPPTSDDYDQKFDRFLADYGKDYGSPQSSEYKRRFQIFKASVDRTKWMNSFRSHEKSAVYGITPYSDLTPDEFHQKVIKRTGDKSGLRRVRRDLMSLDLLASLPPDIPKRMDWRERGVITSVNNQGKCGACWAYSSAETIESMVAIRTREKPVKLSVQQLIDCSDGYNHGCDGGDTCEALSWMSKNHVKLQTDADYPNRDEAGPCLAKNPLTGVQIYSNFTCDNKTGVEMEMIIGLARHGPLIAAVDATSWQDYLGGIIQYHCEANRNHAVQIVGYDLTDEIPHYIIRNTWGTEFGNKGYLNVAIGKNLCAIAEEVSSVDVVV